MKHWSYILLIVPVMLLGCLGYSPQASENLVQPSGTTLSESDAAILRALQQALSAEPDLSIFQTEIVVDSGRVLISGLVRTNQEVALTEQVVSRIEGVNAIDVQLIVDPAFSIPDSEIEEKIIGLLRQQPHIDGLDLIPYVQDGVVTLSGVVRAESQRHQIERIAASVDGVTEVINKITVNPLSPWGRRTTQLNEVLWSTPSNQKSDDELEQDIVNRYELLPHVNENVLRVSADAGVVTLEGTVNSLHALQMAEKYAYMEGASLVDNKLVVNTLHVE